jgi:hypothetical protein
MTVTQAARKVEPSKSFFSQLISLLTNTTEMLSSSITRQHTFASLELVPISALGGDCDALG